MVDSGLTLHYHASPAYADLPWYHTLLTAPYG